MDKQMRGLQSRRIEVDEIWGYVGKKQRHLAPDDDMDRLGDFGTFVALDSDSKAQIAKFYETESVGPGRYSPPKMTGAERAAISGDPDIGRIWSDLYLVCGATRLDDADVHALFANHDFVRLHQSPRSTPAMAAAVTGNLWTMSDLLDAAGSN